MSEPRPEPRPEPPEVSPDGRFYLDEGRWVPFPQDPGAASGAEATRRAAASDVADEVVRRGALAGGTLLFMVLVFPWLLAVPVIAALMWLPPVAAVPVIVVVASAVCYLGWRVVTSTRG